ncbi:hypothetical protein [Chroococcidiopsis sp. SAG 2025]|uniref:hypothetical protein n=1 Tax=Chroococcidiopsis sp. SAG 2025 TaxID=171389 RepID=UPI002937101F|nr:hypothetical protein [Chroococcidiopsis sp. SAG 2025]
MNARTPSHALPAIPDLVYVLFHTFNLRTIQRQRSETMKFKLDISNTTLVLKIEDSL